jgi:hypothetical protein
MSLSTAIKSFVFSKIALFNLYTKFFLSKPYFTHMLLGNHCPAGIFPILSLFFLLADNKNMQ